MNLYGKYDLLFEKYSGINSQGGGGGGVPVAHSLMVLMPDCGGGKFCSVNSGYGLE